MIRILLPSLATLFALTALPPAPPRKPVRQDDRVATVLDRQGTALVRPAGRQRWTPLVQKAVLLPGDRLRTETRGANALELALRDGGTVVLGPGTLLELGKGRALHLLRGEIEVQAGGGGAVAVTGPDDYRGRTAGTLLLRADEATEVLDRAPRWLQGYRASSTDEWMGSLLAKVDGRDVPLTVGYHKVDVTIRDQIAETVVEQSFVNATDRTLEGVFRFPLPADASISGFGMWVGGELVEADIVERQRARAIYEEILRRKKDPGLLEWEGGNEFKASVYPIFPHSEKRVRLRYTQVLPLEGSLLRYRYALRSDLLQQHPLRDLRIHVDVASATPLAGVTSPTHELAVQATEHTAAVDFEAQEYRPRRDFEIEIGLARPEPVTVIHHERNGDGYLMLLLTPPDQETAGWQRELVPDGKPLRLLLIADTSGSMDRASRAAQHRFVAALLDMLGPEDRFSLMTCDVSARWFRQGEVQADDANRQAALAFLEQRDSLGWTDLDTALEKAAAAAGDGTTVVYVGDGIPTTGDADPDALARRLRTLDLGGATLHAVATSASYEKAVLEAMAAHGGSVRQAGDDPESAAYRLLVEAAKPALKDLQVAFEGLQTARIYPDPLPNLPLGRQQVVLGRYLPTGEALAGRVLVTGRLEGETRRYATEVTIEPGETGNSFLPRLWARAHIEALLAAGGDKQEIVEYSERFGIMTPFTSFLVLENDADRQEFGVTRQVAMRDGQRFFATARDRTATETLRQAMAKAGSWRKNLRRAMLREIAGLGEDLYGLDVAVGDLPAVERLGMKLEWSSTLAGGLKEGKALRSEAEAPAEAYDEISERDAGEVVLEDLQEFDLELGETLLQPEAEEGRANEPPATLAFDDNFLGNRRRAENRPAAKRGLFGRRIYQPPAPRTDFGFPALPEAAAEPVPRPDPAWDAEVLAIVRGLDHRGALAGAALQLGIAARSHHPRNGLTGPDEVTELVYAAGDWRQRQTSVLRGEVVQWVRGGQRGVLLADFGLGRQRKAAPADRRFPLAQTYLGTRDLVAAYRQWNARLVREGERRTVVLEAPAPSHQRLELVVDGQGRLLEMRSYDRAALRSRLVLAEPVQAAGTTWARSARRYDGDGNLVWSAEIEPRELGAEQATAEIGEVAARVSQAVLLPATMPELDEAREAVHRGEAPFAMHFSLVWHETDRQRWEAALAHWRAARRLVQGRPGARWIELQLLALARRPGELLALAGEQANAATGVAQAARLLQIAGTVLGGRERLALLQAMRRAYGPEGDLTDLRRRQFARTRASILQQLDRQDEALAALTALATAEPRDSRATLDLVRGLQAAGRGDAAVATARQALARSDWRRGERDTLFSALTDVLWGLRRLDDLRAETGRWVAEGPETAEAWSRHLTVLLFSNRAAEADHLVDELRRGELRPAADRRQHAAIQAALQFTMGNGWNYYVYDFSRDQAERAAAWVRALARLDEGGFELAGQILGDWRFRRTDAYAELTAALRAELTAKDAVSSMAPARLRGLVQALSWQTDDCPPETWRDVFGALQQRFAAADSAYELETLGRLLLQLCDSRNEADRALAVLRDWLPRAAIDERPALARDLLQRLARTDWSVAIEEEMLDLLPVLAPAYGTPAERVQAAAGGARFAAAELRKMRQRALLGAPAEVEKLPRAERRQRMRAARQAAVTALAEVFDRAAGGEGAAAWLSPWLSIEARCFQVRAAAAKDAAALASAAEAARALLVASFGREDGDAGELFRALRERCSLVMAYAAIRRNAGEDLADRVLSFYESAQQEHEGELDWRYQTFRLLLALDRTEALRATLQQWIAPSRLDRPWRLALAWLHAEEGRLQDAVQVLERLVADSDLEPEHYAALADWYLVLGDEARRQRALVARYDAMDLDDLHRLVEQERRSVRGGADGVPVSLDPEVVRAATALLRKAPQPANYLWTVRNLYRATKDFRTLTPVIAGVPGHSPEAAYAFLQQLTGVLDDVHEEATLDELAAAIAGAESRYSEPPDRRGLRLLRALVHRRAARVREGGEARYPAMNEALQQALAEAVEEVEVVPLAELLAALGELPTPAARELVLAELEELFASRSPGTAERLAVAVARSNALAANGRGDRAVDALLAALEEHAAARGGRLPHSARNAVETMVRLATARRAFAAAERFLLAERQRQPEGSGERSWYGLQLYSLYATCLDQGGGVSLGSGAELYRRARTDLARFLATADRAHAENLVQVYCRLHRAAHERRVARSVGADLRAFAEGLMLELLPDLPLNHHDVVEQVAETLAVVASRRDGLRVLVQRCLTEPAWHARVGRDGWRQFHWEMARMYQGIDLGDVEDGLERIVLAALERNLRAGNNTGQEFYDQDSRYFWSSRRHEFLTVARRVVETTAGEPAIQLYVARYLWDGLHQRHEATRVLLACDERHILRSDGRWQLARWLRELRRYAESLPHLEKLIADNQDVLAYRTAMVHSLHEAGRDADALALVEGTQARLHQQDRWNESAQTELAQACLDSGFFEHAERMFLEAIRNRERGRPLTRRGDRQRSHLYRQLARAQAALDKHEAAVESAGAAIVCCGERQNDRQEAIAALQEILGGIADLDAFVARRDARVAESGLDSPVVRKGLAEAYAERGQLEKALAQYELARELQPEDIDTIQKTVAILDRLGRKRQACERLLEAIGQNPHDLTLPLALAERLSALGEREEAERAFTQLVEPAPKEAEGHRLLARARGDQGRHAEAVEQWQQVVRLRSFEPEGWLELARAQLAAGQRQQARETLRQVLDRSWDERYGNVKEQAAELLRRAG